ncbi:FadR/GntR family transcriptional regulator [Teredinibacter haidensis]|uniref:FadR/GntR family transcriptional regulator n=1 Tax=Teredinibacter haidensis TaxID=2731755 RepID=UPI000A97681E|nr:FadR/GntR family transcriptional regulator [Teredinibacter haidensis]
MVMLTRLKPLTLVDQANEQLYQYIDQNGLEEGDSLPSIAELSEKFGASRAVIRESLKSLEAKGIIEIANGKRAKIKPVTSEPLLDYFQRFMQVDQRAAWEFAEIRIALEIQSVSLAIQRGSDAELHGLYALVREMRENMHNAEAFADLDVRFHLLIAHATHNTMMVHLLESLRDAIRASVRKGLHKRLNREQMSAVQGFHERLAERLIKRDVDGATEAMHAHFDEIAMSLE